MRRIVLFGLFLILSIVSTYALESYSIKKEKIKAVKDSIVVKNGTDTVPEGEKPTLREFISEKTDKLVGSLFGASKTLNNADSIINEFDASPSFGIYKDNYIVVGTDLTRGMTENDSDAKFQVSIRHRVTNSTLPFKTYLFVTYTQLAFWDVFKESFPFRDLNYNPSIGFARVLVRKNRLLGTIDLQFEHESNGKDGEDSRSWNKISFGGLLMLNDRWTLQGKAWIPIVDGGNNKDIVSYKGWGHIGLDYTSPKDKYSFGLLLTKRAGHIFDHNITLRASVRLFNDDNQFLFMEYYNGYGESMLGYKQYRQRLRFGIVIRPRIPGMY